VLLDYLSLFDDGAVEPPFQNFVSTRDELVGVPFFQMGVRLKALEDHDGYSTPWSRANRHT
jgi:hypothetical protein